MHRVRNPVAAIALAISATAGSGADVQAQAVTAADLIDAWDVMTEMVVAAAQAMPADAYTFTPGEPLRSFADQINHTTQSNLGFAQAVRAGRPDFPIPDRSNPPQDKAAVIDLLTKSFAHFRSGLASLSDGDLAADVPWGPPSNRRPITRMKAFLIVTSHLQREHGKTIMYLRAQGITPPPSGSWRFE